ACIPREAPAHARSAPARTPRPAATVQAPAKAPVPSPASSLPLQPSPSPRSGPCFRSLAGSGTPSLRSLLPHPPRHGAALFHHEDLHREDLVRGIVAGVEVVHVRQLPAIALPGGDVVGEDDLVVLAQRQLLLGLAPVLVERGG